MKAAASTHRQPTQDQSVWRQWRKEILAQRPQPIAGLQCTWQSQQGGMKHLSVALNLPQMTLGSSPEALISFPDLEIFAFHLVFQYIAPGRVLIINLNTMEQRELLAGEQVRLGESSLQFEFQSELEAQVLPSAPWLSYLSLKEKELQQGRGGEVKQVQPTLSLVPGQLWVEDEWCQLKLPKIHSGPEHWQQELTPHVQLLNNYIDLADDRVVHFLQRDQPPLFAGEDQLKDHYYAQVMPLKESQAEPRGELGTLSFSHYFADSLMGHEQYFLRKRQTTLRWSEVYPEFKHLWKPDELMLSYDQRQQQWWWHLPAMMRKDQLPQTLPALLGEKQLFSYEGDHFVLTLSAQRVVARRWSLSWLSREQLREWRDFGAILFPLLLLLLVTVPKPEKEEKQEVVIYAEDIVEQVQVKKAPAAQSASVAKSETKTLTAPKVAEQPKLPELPTEKTVEQKVEEQVNEAKEEMSEKLTSLFGKKVSKKTLEKSNAAKSAAQGSASSALSGATSRDLKRGAFGGNSAGKGLAVSGELTGKGFKGNKGSKRGFDAGFTSTKTIVVGSIDPEILRKLLREYIPQFRYCYQAELIQNPKVAGVIDLAFTINGQGKVSSSKATSKGQSFSSAGLRCIQGVLAMIPFPAPKGGGRVDVKQPLNFSSERTRE